MLTLVPISVRTFRATIVLLFSPGGPESSHSRRNDTFHGYWYTHYTIPNEKQAAN